MKMREGSWLPSDMRLADQDVAPERADWFARTRLNVIDWYPQKTFNAFCILVLLIATYRQVGPGLCGMFAALCITPMVAVHILYRQSRWKAAVDHVWVLRWRAVLAVVNAGCWSLTLGTALALSSGASFTLVLALSFYRLMMTGLINFSVPFAGTLALFLLSCGIGTGLVINLGWAGAGIAAIVALAAHSLYSVSFNLYYMFATRRLRTRTL